MQRSKCFRLLQTSLTHRQNISPVAQSEQAFHSSQSTRPHSCIFLPLSAWFTAPYQFISNPNPPPSPLSTNVHVDTLHVYYLVSWQRLYRRSASLANQSSLPVTPVQARADTLHSHILPKHGNPPLTAGGGRDLRVQRFERSWALPDKNCTLVRG